MSMISLMSIIGPASRNDSSEPIVKVLAYASAKKASMLEQIETTKPRLIMAITESIGSVPRALMIERGTNICMAAAIIAPITSMVKSCQNSLRAELMIERAERSSAWFSQYFWKAELITLFSFMKLTISAVIWTISKAKITRHQTMRGSKLKAVMVVMMVIGLRIGAANRKLITSAGLKPLASKLRATGTLPHSQTGRAMPEIEMRMRRMIGCFGKILSNRLGGKNRRISDEVMMPSIRKGVASTTTLRVSVRKSCSVVRSWLMSEEISLLNSHFPT